MTTLASTLRSLVPAVAMTIAAVAAATGCARPGEGRLARSTSLAGRLSVTSLPAVDVVNPNGTVHVVIDEREPAARWECNITADDTVDPATLARLRAEGMTATVAIQNGQNVIRIRPTEELLNTQGVFVDIEVRAPSNRGVYIRSTGGPIALTNVSGPISITNGLREGPGGNVVLRTDFPLTDPVWIDTPRGNVECFIPPTAKGAFSLRTDDGQANFYALQGTLTHVRVFPQAWQGVLNAGTNEVVLRSGSGHVRCSVVDSPTSQRHQPGDPRSWDP